MQLSLTDEEKALWYKEGMKDADITISSRVKALDEVEIRQAMDKHVRPGESKPFSLEAIFHIAQAAFVEKNFKLIEGHAPQWLNQMPEPKEEAPASKAPPSAPILGVRSPIVVAPQEPVEVISQGASFKVSPTLHGEHRA